MRTDLRLASLILLGSFTVSSLYLSLFWKDLLGDYATYWIQARYAQEHPGVDIYDPAVRQAVNDLGLTLRRAMGRAEEPFVVFSVTQTPFFTSLVSMLSTGDLDLDQKVFNAVNLAVLLCALAITLRSLACSAAFSVFAVLWVLFMDLPLQSDLGNSNFNGLLLGLLVVSIWLTAGGAPAGRFGAGLLSGLAVMMKPTVVYPLAALAVSRLARGRARASTLEMCGLLAGSSLALAVSAVRFGGVAIWFSWARRILSLPYELSPLSSFNFSLPAAVWTFYGRDISFLTGPIFILLLAAALLPAPRAPSVGVPDWRSEFSRDFNILGLGCLAFLLGSPLAWLHYYVFCLPTTLVIARALAGRNGSGWGKGPAFTVAAALGICSTAVWPIRLLFPDLTLVGGFVMVWGGAFALWVLGLLELEAGGSIPVNPPGPGG